MTGASASASLMKIVIPAPSEILTSDIAPSCMQNPMPTEPFFSLIGLESSIENRPVMWPGQKAFRRPPSLKLVVPLKYHKLHWPAELFDH